MNERTNGGPERQRPLRPLHVMESWRPVTSGYATRSWALAAAQARHSVLEPRVLVTSRQRTHGASEIRIAPWLEGKIVAQPPSRPERAWRRVRAFHLDRGALTQALCAAGRHWNVDLVHGHWSSGIGAAARDAARRLGVPFVAEVRFDLAGAFTTETLRLSATPLVERVLRRWFERHLAAADAVVAASHSLADLLQSSLPAVEAPPTVVSNGVDLDAFTPGPPDAALAKELGLEGRTVVGTTSNMLRFEGLDVLLRVLAKARRRQPTGRPRLHILFVGDGPERARLERLARRLEVPATFTGRVPFEDVPRHLRLVDLFAVPRRAVSITRHASPIKLAEAMACGCAVVASRVGDIPQHLADGRGCLVPPDAPDALGDALLQLASDDDRRLKIGRRAHAWAQEHFSWDESARVYRGVYQRALRSFSSPERVAM